MSKTKTPLTLNYKTQGSALLVSIFLSGLMLSIGLMAAKLAVQEVEVSADLFLSEKAYLSAESGVEKALWLLKNEPLAHVVADDTSKETGLEDTNTEVSIRNKITPSGDSFHKDKFQFTLPNLQSQKFRFRYDNDPSVTTTENIINSSVTVETSGKWFWRFLCQNTSGQTVALQADHNGTTNNLTAETGKDDNGNDYSFNTWIDAQKDSCYVSIQNISGGEQTYVFKNATMAPNSAHVHAVGLQQGRQKHIRFDYAQKTLGSLFDFSFLHSEGGL